MNITDPLDSLPDEEDNIFTNSQEALDHTPLTFGMHKGKTPEQVAEMGVRGESYIRWLYETVSDKPTCSAALYKECKGTSIKAIRATRMNPAHGAPYGTGSYEGVGGGHQHAKVDRFGFDDMDDDIPF